MKGLATPALDITVLTVPESGNLDVTREVATVKAALLYADHVTLVSPTAAMLVAATSIFSVPDRQREDRLLDLASVLMEPSQVATLSVLRSRSARRSRDMLFLQEQLRAQMRPSVTQVAAVLDAVRQSPGMADLERAQAAGAVTLKTLGLDPVESLQDAVLLAAGRRERGRVSIDIVPRMLREITESVAPSATAFPLFDDAAGGLLRVMSDEGQLPGLDLRPATHAHLAGHLVGTIAALPDAPVDEILDVRRDLREPLVRFRAAVSAMARELDATPLDASFARQADEFYRERVAPELLALEESIREGRFREQLLRQAPAAGPGLKTAIKLGFAAYTFLPSLTAAAVASGVGAAQATTSLLAEIGKRQLELAGQRRSNKMLFLHEAGRSLNWRSADRRGRLANS